SSRLRCVSASTLGKLLDARGAARCSADFGAGTTDTSRFTTVQLRPAVSRCTLVYCGRPSSPMHFHTVPCACAGRNVARAATPSKNLLTFMTTPMSMSRPKVYARRVKVRYQFSPPAAPKSSRSPGACTCAPACADDYRRDMHRELVYRGGAAAVSVGRNFHLLLAARGERRPGTNVLSML